MNGSGNNGRAGEGYRKRSPDEQKRFAFAKPRVPMPHSFRQLCQATGEPA